MKIAPIPNAYENVKKACDQRLKELYPHGIPKLAQERYETELQYMKNSEYLDDFEVYRQLSEEAKKSSQFFTFRGTIAGSYLIYLMGYGRNNPLQAHYYCPVCGHFETVNTHLFGIDLPESTCPTCGAAMLGDGFNLPIESVWGVDGTREPSFEYSISEEFRPFAQRVVMNIYPDNLIVPLGVWTAHVIAPGVEDVMEMVPFGFIVLPPGHTMEDYPDMMSYLESGEPCLSIPRPSAFDPDIRCIRLSTDDILDKMMILQRHTGIYAYETSIAELRDLNYNDLANNRRLGKYVEEFFRINMPKNYRDMTAYICMSHNTYNYPEEPRDYDDTYYRITDFLLDTPEFKKYPCISREDFFDYLVETGSSREDAWNIAEYIRKGKAVSYQEIFDQFQMPPEINTLGKKIRYLFPRAHALEQMMTFARMAFYMKADSRGYSRIITRK